MYRFHSPYSVVSFGNGAMNMADVAIMLGAGLFVFGELGWSQKSGNRPTAGTPSAVPQV